MSITRQRLGKQVSASTDTQATTEKLLGIVFSVRSARSGNKRRELVNWYWYLVPYPCGGGVQYLHRDPASRRRRRKGKSQSETVKYGLKSQGNSDPRKTALARASSTYKRQTRPLVGEGAPQEQDRNRHTCNKDLVVSPSWVLYSKTDWPAERRW
jgi:hypothetical protein